MSGTWIAQSARVAATLLAAALGGFLFQLAGLPLPWMLGPMCATFAASLLAMPVLVPERARPPMVTIVGTLLGANITMQMLAQAMQWWLPLAGVLALVAAGAAVGMLYFRFVGRLDWKTAYFAGMPGGIVEMLTLGAAFGADTRPIAVVHASRILLTVFLVPFLIWALSNGVSLPAPPVQQAGIGGGLETWLWMALCCVAGYYGGRLLRLPAPELLGPVFLSASLHLSGLTTFATPAIMVAVAQIVIGSLIGCRFAGMKTREVAKLIGLGAGSVLLLIVLTLCVAFVVAALTGISPRLLVLAYAPGGLTEMSLIALALHFDVSLVIVLHIVRILLVALGAAPVLALTGARAAAGAAHGSSPPVSRKNKDEQD